MVGASAGLLSSVLYTACVCRSKSVHDPVRGFLEAVRKQGHLKIEPVIAWEQVCFILPFNVL